MNMDLELDLNVNIISPMWPENDFLDNVKDLTDAILTDNLSFDSASTCIDFDTDTNTSINTNHDFGWNFYYEDIRSNIDDTSNVLLQVDSTTNNHIDSVLESWSDTCSLDVLKDSLFELEIFNDVNNLSVTTPAASATTTATTTATAITTATAASLEADHIVEWNRRRSLLYDKNEFVQSTIAADDQRRVKSNTSCLSASISLSTVEQRTFRCSVRDCDKTYYKASHLKSHMRRHSGVKPFACDWDGCKWRFSRSDELARHKRSHSGIKPYSCDLCDKAFSRSDHLSKHAKVHMKKMALYGTPIITKKCNYKYLTVNRIPVE